MCCLNTAHCHFALYWGRGAIYVTCGCQFEYKVKRLASGIVIDGTCGRPPPVPRHELCALAGFFSYRCRRDRRVSLQSPKYKHREQAKTKTLVILRKKKKLPQNAKTNHHNAAHDKEPV